MSGTLPDTWTDIKINSSHSLKVYSFRARK